MILTDQYIAGFFDGEGCVSGSVIIGRSSYIQVQITQKLPEILIEIQKLYGGRLIKVSGYKDIRCHRLSFSNLEAKMLLYAIRDFVVVKKKQVDLAIDFLKLMEEQPLKRGGRRNLGGSMTDACISRNHIVRNIIKSNKDNRTLIV